MNLKWLIDNWDLKFNNTRIRKEAVLGTFKYSCRYYNVIKLFASICFIFRLDSPHSGAFEGDLQISLTKTLSPGHIYALSIISKTKSLINIIFRKIPVQIFAIQDRHRNFSNKIRSQRNDQWQDYYTATVQGHHYFPSPPILPIKNF